MSDADASEMLSSAVVALLMPQAAMLARSHRHKEAEDLLKRLSSLGSDPDVQVLIGKVRVQQGDVLGGKAAFEAALLLRPDHAQALQALRSLTSGQPAKYRRLLAVCVVTMIVIVLCLLFLRPPSDTRPAVRMPPIATVSPAVAPKAAHNPEGMTARYKQFADVSRVLERASGQANIIAEPVEVDGNFGVRLRGDAPTEHVRSSLLAKLAPAGQIAIDAAGVNITHRYVVRRGDTLEGIAIRMYGKAARWRELWRDNRGAIANPHRLAEGIELRMP